VALTQAAHGKTDGKTHVRPQHVTLLTGDGKSQASPLLTGPLAGNAETVRTQHQSTALQNVIQGQGQHSAQQQTDGQQTRHPTNGGDARQTTLATSMLTTQNGGQNNSDATARMIQTAMAAQ